MALSPRHVIGGGNAKIGGERVALPAYSKSLANSNTVLVRIPR